MVLRFFGLLLLFCFLPTSLSQSYQHGQYGNYLHNQFPQGAGGSYPNQPQNANYHQHAPQKSNYAYQRGNQNTQFGARYQSSSVQITTPSPAIARGVVQQPRAQPLPRAFAANNNPSSELAPLATASPDFSHQTAPQPQNFPNYPPQPQQQPNFFYPPVSGSNYNNQPPPSPPQQQFQQPNTFDPNSNYYNPYQNNTSQYNREPPVINYTFKEGTPPYYCAYGLPVPEYNTPRKRCIPWHPMCGIVFTCIMDV